MLKNTFDFLARVAGVSLIAGLTILAVAKILGPTQIGLDLVSTQKENFFEVRETAKVYAKPDVAVVNVSVLKEGKSAQGVQMEMNKANNSVLAAMKKLEIKEEDIKTLAFSITPKYTYNSQTGQQKIDGYIANSTLEIKTKDFDKINQVIDSALAAGANEVGNLNFAVEDRQKYSAEARAKAIALAQKKAQAIAGEAGLALGRLVDVKVDENDYQPPMYAARAMMTEDVGGTTTVEPGQNEISVGVSLFYALQ